MPRISKYQKGLKREIELSAEIHRSGIPLLVSALTLRSLCGGQIDLAVFDQKRDLIKVFEVKHKDSYGLLQSQYNRLKRSVDWLGTIFDKKISFEVLS